MIQGEWLGLGYKAGIDDPDSRVGMVFDVQGRHVNYMAATGWRLAEGRYTRRYFN